MPGLVCRASRLGTHGRAKRDGMAGTGPAMTTQVVQGKQKNALARSGQITRKISSRTRVTAAEISSEPIHPTRLEKKKNTISLALGAALQRRRSDRRDALSPAMIDTNAWPVGAFRQVQNAIVKPRTVPSGYVGNATYAGFARAVICSSTSPLVSTPTSSSANDAIRKVSAKVSRT